MEDILINWTPQETRVAVVENGSVQELHIERTLERGLVGNVYLGKVARVLPGMQSAFIDIGLERAAFLHVADLHLNGVNPRGHHGPHGEAAQAVPIERQVYEGQALTVQVIKDPIGTKGARLSTQISIAGRLLVHLPQDNHIGISQKIGSPEARDALRTRWCRPACRTATPAASSCGPTPRKPAMTNWAPTSATCARPGIPSARSP
jgi:ribonuclease G